MKDFMRRLRAIKLVALSTSVVVVSILGLFLGLIRAQAHGPEFTAPIPALELAVERAGFIARALLGFFRSLGIFDRWAAVFSLGLGIFANNALVAVLIALSPILILKAKPFSDKHLSKIYYKYGIWLFKPIGWTTYKILSLILPLYGLALQCYIIGGIAIVKGLAFEGLEFLPLEVASITAICISAATPALSENPDQALPRYLKSIKKLLLATLPMLFVAALLEANAILRIRYIP
ncbi:MAG: hypothetical protein N3F65_00770 [Nitrososphaeria archaeon]|nr:hypothetical protein [Nitrososphaeria archaeon]